MTYGIKTRAIAFGSALAIALVPAVAAAQTGYGAAGVGASVNVGKAVQVTAGATTSAAASAAAQMQAAASSSMEGAVGASSSAQSDDVGSSAVTGLNVGTAVSLTRSNVDATAQVQPMAATDVSSSAGVDTFARSIIQADSDVSAVNSDGDSVSVSYEEPAKLFGFIPSHVTATAEVDGDGTVEVHYPWYAFLMATGNASTDAAVNAQVNNAATYAVGVSFSATTQAELIQALHDALKAQASGQVSADATTAVSAPAAGSY